MANDFISFDEYLKMSGIAKEPAEQKKYEDTDNILQKTDDILQEFDYSEHHEHRSHGHHSSDAHHSHHGSEEHHSHHTHERSHTHAEHSQRSHSHSQSSECGHEHTEDNKYFKYMLLGAVGAFILGIIFKVAHLPSAVSAVFLVISTLLAGAPVFIKGGKNAVKGNVDETVLMTIAIIAAACLGEFAEAAAVALFYRLGELMEEFASDRSRASIRAISDIQSETANVLLGSGETEEVSAENIEIGTKIIIYPHERIPLDCEITEGSSDIDTSAVTGESLPVFAEKGSVILSGCINGSETLIAKTINTLEESAASKIIRMVEDASSKKSRSQKLISRIAAYYTPAVLIIAIIVALIPSLVTHQWSVWIHRALVLLVISCPCALVLSVPLGFFTSIGAAARKGILIKGSRYIEETAAAACVAFDKTGTLTTDSLSVGSVSSPVGLERDAVLLLAAMAEHRSQHPIAQAIRAAAAEVPEKLISNTREMAGCGASADFCGKTILCGSKKLFEEKGIDTGDEDGIFVAINNRLAGIIKIESEIRGEADPMINELREAGISKTVMLTGDSYDSAEAVAQQLDVDEFYAEMMPEDKLEKVRELQQIYGKVIYVGDGINDAPVLAAADVGVGMGLGSAAALEAADMVLTNSSISKLAEARKLAEKTMKIFKINVAFIMAVKIIVMILGIAGIAPMWLAVFSDVGVCFISVIISSMIASEDIKSVFTSLIEAIKNAIKK